MKTKRMISKGNQIILEAIHTPFRTENSNPLIFDVANLCPHDARVIQLSWVLSKFGWNCSELCINKDELQVYPISSSLSIV